MLNVKIYNSKSNFLTFRVDKKDIYPNVKKQGSYSILYYQIPLDEESNMLKYTVKLGRSDFLLKIFPLMWLHA